MSNEPYHIYEFGPYRLDAAERLLLRDGEVISLQPKVFDLLLALVERRGRLLGKDELIKMVWPDTLVEESNLANNISILRKALGENRGRFIETVPKRGYRFIAPIKQSCEERSAPEGSNVIFTGDEMGPSSGVVTSGKLIGREAELSRLQNWLETALRGERRVVFVTGEPGIGKTALVKAFLQRVAANRRILIAHGQCLEQYGAGEAYLPVLDALSRLCHEPGRKLVIDMLAQRAPTWLVQMPSLISVAERAAMSREIFGATRDRMLREMTETIEALTSDTPLVLLLEDLHWSDYSTLDLISALAQRCETARLLLIGTWRPVEVNLSGHPLKAVKQELQMRRCCTELPLGLLTEATVGEYVAALFPQQRFPEGLARLIHQRTDGNPLFMVNVVDYLLGQGLIIEHDGQWELKAELTEIEVGVPESIRQMIERQIDRLSGAEQRVLEAASIAGVEFSSASVAAALTGDVVQIEEQCERLTCHSQFLRPAGISQWPDDTASASYGFIHVLHQNVFYHRVTEARRNQMHRLVGERLESAYGSRAGEIAVELAMHFKYGRDYRRAVEYLRQAAENALRSYSNREAIDYLTEAMKLVEALPAAELPSLQLTMLEKLGLIYTSMSDNTRAIEAYAARVAITRKEGQVESEIRALLNLADVFYMTDHQRFLKLLEEISELSTQVQDKLLRVCARGYCGNWNLHLRGWREEDHLAMVEAIEAAREADDHLLLGEFLMHTARHQCRKSEYRAACRSAKECRQLTRRSGDAHHYMAGQYFGALAFLHLGEWGKAMRLVRDGLEMAEKNSHYAVVMGFQIVLALLHEQAFDFERVRELCEAILQQFRAEHFSDATSTEHFSHTMSTVLLGIAHQGMRQYDHAFNCFNELANQIEQMPIYVDWIFYLLLHRGLSLYWLEQREFDMARREAVQLCQFAAESGERTYLAIGQRILAEIAIAEHNYEQAESELALAFDTVRQGEIPLAEWRVWQTAARLHLAKGHGAEAERDWVRSQTILNGLADSLGQDETLRQRLLDHLPMQEKTMYCIY